MIMSNQLMNLLYSWQKQKDEMQWVLATIFETAGSSYRKSGAMMLINSMGQYKGLLSGGCLEADIMRRARQCWDSGKNRIIQYDMREEDDLSWTLGLGCGGMVKILLQPIVAQHGYLGLPELMMKLEAQQRCGYVQQLNEDIPSNYLVPVEEAERSLAEGEKAGQFEKDGSVFLLHCLKPPPFVAVFGGGLDAKPLVSMAIELGWRVKLIDPRPANAREAYFRGAELFKKEILSLESEPWLHNLDAAIVMSHNIELDAQALTVLKEQKLKYLGVLGPEHRTARVLKLAGLSAADLPVRLANPMGLRLGGDLPESIALSVLAEVHAVLENQNAESISGLFSAVHQKVKVAKFS
ncbi:putative xanthine dehydrogenase subunit A [Rheinheimera sp. MM224]|nr:putative xanthine dehydrogenase subunit A [Rheinheimera sp. MM224]